MAKTPVIAIVDDDEGVRASLASLVRSLGYEAHAYESGVAFLKEVRTRVLWPPPGVDLWSAIAGLLGSHEAPPPGAPTPAAGRRRTSALLLEGDVTPAIARRADAAGAPRHWVVERVQRVRIPRSGLESLARRGVRWSVLQPVEVVGIALSPELASARQRWKRLLPPDVPVWVFPK